MTPFERPFDEKPSYVALINLLWTVPAVDVIKVANFGGIIGYYLQFQLKQKNKKRHHHFAPAHLVNQPYLSTDT